LHALLSTHPRAPRPPDRDRRGRRKLGCLLWAMLWREQDYAFGQPSMTARKIRRLEITAGAPRRHNSRGVWAIAMREAERDLARQAEHAYTQTIRDRQAAGQVKAGASATPGHVSQRPLRAKPRGRPQAPDICTSLRQSLAPTETIPPEAQSSKPHLTFSVQKSAASEPVASGASGRSSAGDGLTH
jgi:hypothetical protein